MSGYSARAYMPHDKPCEPLAVTIVPQRQVWGLHILGLPQGSVLGPLPYILFTADIGPLRASWSLASHSYADDVQSYKHSAIRTICPRPLMLSMPGCHLIVCC